jgi:ornithine--oxo-acid transaminase
MGDYLQKRLRECLAPFEMIRDVRGMGLLCGIEFQAPRAVRLRLSYEAFKAIHPAMFGQMLVMRLFHEKNIMVQVCGNNYQVLKVAPPLVVSKAQVDYFTDSIRDVVEAVHSSSAFWSDALQLVKRLTKL